MLLSKLPSKFHLARTSAPHLKSSASGNACPSSRNPLLGAHTARRLCTRQRPGITTRFRRRETRRLEYIFPAPVGSLLFQAQPAAVLPALHRLWERDVQPHEESRPRGDR